MAPVQEDPTGLSEKQFDITIVSATATSLVSLNADIYVLVALGDGIQKVDGVPLVSPDTEHTTVTWNKTLHFTFEVGQANDATDFTVSLYQKHEGSDILLGQTIEDLSRIDKDTDVTRQFLDSGSSITFRVGKSRIFALIIGISEYLDQDANLYGCVTDALDMENFLRNDLKVPGENLRVLHNQDATRQNILDSIQSHLLENTNISYGDAMIIFYAGHGCRDEAPTGWISSDGMIEEMCPHDQNGPDQDGNPICGIPDRTINALVRRIAEAKGNNIALIFDSCHSGGVDRGNEEKDDIQCRVRSFPNPCPLDGSVDIAIWGGESSRGADQVLPAGFSHKDMASHVLLAACKPNQYSRESGGNDPRGLFSSHLIPMLRELHLQSMPLSYLQVINQIPRIPYQTQQCLGTNKDCIMFTLGRPTPKSKLHFELKFTDDGFEVGLGSMHGVVVGTEFSVVQGPQRERIGLLVATKVLRKRSTLVPAEDTRMNVPPGAEALIWNWNNISLTLNVFTNSEKVQNYVSFVTGLHTGYNIRLVASESDAHVSLSWNNNDEKYEVERLPGFLTDHPDIKGECKGAADNLSDILTAICHFHYHLQHSKMIKSDIQVGTSLSAGASVEMHLLRLESLDGSPGYLPILVPGSSRDLFDSQCSANLSGRTPEQSYGIEVVNNSTTALFVYLFYFNPADYSIQEWFHPPSHTMDPPLQPGQSLTIGYGANGGEPFCFDVDEGEEEGTGFLKLFVSSTYIDMTYLTQDTPFTSQQSPRAEPKTGIKNVTGSLVAKITVDST